MRTSVRGLIEALSEIDDKDAFVEIVMEIKDGKAVKTKEVSQIGRDDDPEGYVSLS